VRAAEFRGPGIHHRYDDSPEDLDMDMMDHRARNFGSMGNRIILLGDGTELSTSEADMFDHDDEDHDLEHQVHKGVSSDEEDDDSSFSSEIRKQREGTPGPSGPLITSAEAEKSTPPVTASPSSISTEKSESAPETSKTEAAASSTETKGPEKA